MACWQLANRIAVQTSFKVIYMASKGEFDLLNSAATEFGSSDVSARLKNPRKLRKILKIFQSLSIFRTSG